MRTANQRYFFAIEATRLKMSLQLASAVAGPSNPLRLVPFDFSDSKNWNLRAATAFSECSTGLGFHQRMKATGPGARLAIADKRWSSEMHCLAQCYSRGTKCATHVIRSAFVRRKVEEELSYVASKACFTGEASK
jgi:hypothetical protein